MGKGLIWLPFVFFGRRGWGMRATRIELQSEGFRDLITAPTPLVAQRFTNGGIRGLGETTTPSSPLSGSPGNFRILWRESLGALCFHGQPSRPAITPVINDFERLGMTLNEFFERICDYDCLLFLRYRSPHSADGCRHHGFAPWAVFALGAAGLASGGGGFGGWHVAGGLRAGSPGGAGGGGDRRYDSVPVVAGL
ncbi:MAG: hypothetical protein EA001_03155 [Oscillatoriales cyanobacterium]|nr:MAG: hypothetical protein EA001_03155 [Oscillatoriales cyanobacterium]